MFRSINVDLVIAVSTFTEDTSLTRVNTNLTVFVPYQVLMLVILVNNLKLRDTITPRYIVRPLLRTHQVELLLT